MIKLGRDKHCGEVNESVCAPVMFSHSSARTACVRKFGQLLRLCIPDQFSSIYSCEKTNNAEYRTSSVLILRACKKSFNRRKDLHCVPLVDVVDALALPLPPLVHLLQHTELSQSRCLLSEIIRSCIFGFFSPPLEC